MHSSNGKNYTTTTLTSRNSITLTFTWNTTGVAKGNYTITANAIILESEEDTAHNVYEDGWVFVTLIGDVNGDRKVDIEDIFNIALHFGGNYGDPCYVPNYDVNGDDKIDIEDIFIAATHYGETW